MIFDPGWPTCAVCGRPVERLARVEDRVRQKLTVVAECHGDVESVDIAEADLVTNAERIKFARAFVGAARALPAGAKVLPA